MKKRIITMALAVIMLLAVLTGCGDNASNPGNDTPTPQVVKLSVGTGAVGGSVYTTGSGWANVMNNVLAGRYELTAEQTGGTVANVSLIETGEVEIGIVATDILYGAYTGTASWANGVKYQKPLAMFTCDMPSLCPFTLAGSGITTLHDLDGKRVGLGPKGSSIDSVFGVVFEEMGITPSMIHNDTWSATITALQDGVIDAIVVQSPAPWPSLTELEATQTVSMIQMTDDELAIPSSPLAPIRPMQTSRSRPCASGPSWPLPPMFPSRSSMICWMPPSATTMTSPSSITPLSWLFPKTPRRLV